MADFTIDDFQDVVVEGVESVEDERVTGAVVGWAVGQVDQWVDELYTEYPAGYSLCVGALLERLHVVFAEEQVGYVASFGEDVDAGVIGLAVFEAVQEGVEGEFDLRDEVEL